MRLRLPDFKKICTWKVARFGKVVSPKHRTPGTHFRYRLSRVQDHSAARRIMSIPTTPSGIETATFRLVAQCATTCPPITINWFHSEVSLLSSQNRSTRSSRQPDVPVNWVLSLYANITWILFFTDNLRQLHTALELRCGHPCYI